MANYNLTNQPISASFQQLLQKNDSDFLVDGTGSLIQSLKVTGSISSSTYYGDGSNLTGISAGAVATGSLLKTASFDNGTRNMTFTKGDSSTFDVNIPGGSVDTGSLIETASIADATITFTKADASQFSIEVNNVSASIQAEDLVITVKNESGVTLPAGTAVKATGVVGENITIVSASADNPSLMPAIGVLNQEIANNATGECYIAGRLENIDTSNLVAGAAVYVNNNGALTATKPTGSSLIQNIGIAAKINATEGELVIQGSGRSNDLPNLTEGYIWVGDSNGVPEEFSTGSIAFINKNNTFTGTQNFNNISVSGTGSFGYIEAITGSAKIIGDAFIILNNDTPTERYAGIKVIDSGSSQATASLQFDGQTNDWFYEYTASGDPTNHGVVMFGPEYGTKGSPTYLTNNRVPIGDGGHHLNDSNLEINGTNLEMPAIAAVGRFANANVNVDSDQGTIYGAFKIDNKGTIAGGNTDVNIELTEFSGLDADPVMRFRAGGTGGQNSDTVFAAFTKSDVNFYKNTTWVSGANVITSGSFTTEGITDFNGDTQLASGITTNIAATDRTNTFTEKQIVSGSDGFITQTFTAPGTNVEKALVNITGAEVTSTPYNRVFFGMADYPSFGTVYEDYFAIEYYNSTGYNYGSEFNLNGRITQMKVLPSGSGAANQGFFKITDNYNGTTSTEVRGTYINVGTNTNTQFTTIGNNSNTTNLNGNEIQVYASNTIFNNQVTPKALISSSAAISASAFVGDGSQLTGVAGGIFVQTGSFYSTTNDLQVTGSFGVSKAIGGKNSDLTITSNTASIDLTQSNTFTVTLVSSADTHLDVSTFGEDAQSVNILVKQPAAGNTGSISFSPDFKFGQGYSYSPTPANSAEDILSFTRFSNSLYGTYINNFS